METKMIGNKIAEARNKLNISQAQLAKSLFISAQAVGKWERGESMPDITTLNRLAEIFGVDLNYFSENFQPLENELKSIDSSMKQSNVLRIDEKKNRPTRNMSENSWVDADFSRLNNINENLNFSNIQNCKFIGSDLAGLSLKSNQIINNDFSSSNLSQCRFQTTDLISNSFKDSSLIEAEFSKSTLKGCDFKAADLTKVFFNLSTFLKNTITNVVWNATTFKDTQIEDVVFEGTIENCHFENCVFKGVKFQNATIINTFFKYNRKLNRVQFIDCKVDNLTFAFLKNGKADLAGITLITQ
jgi:transcriptional regulator with XRE-family HTH domain